MSDINLDERTYTTRMGVVLALQPISPIIVMRLRSDKWGMPQPPVEEVAVGPKQKLVKQANKEDPDYKERLRQWEIDQNEKILIYAWSQGIKTNPPKKDLDLMIELFPGASENQLKYLWVSSVLGDDDDIAELTEAIISQSVVTEQGIRDAEETFPSNGQPHGHQEVPAPEFAIDH